MKKLIFYFVILLASVWLGIKINANSGYVLISYQHWSIETTFWVALLFFLLCLLVVHLLLRIIGGTTRLSGRWHHWADRRHLRQARKLSNRGLCELAEGNWENAEKYLMRGAKHNEMPLINYLAAARAAQGQQAFDRRDNYLRQAYAATGGEEEIAIGLTQAQLQLASKQLEQALATLRHLNQLAPHHAHILSLLQTVYLELNDWEDLRKLLPELRKYAVFDAAALHSLEQKVYTALLEAAANANEDAKLAVVWENVPKHLRKDPLVLSRYAKYLIQFDHHNEAEALLREALKSSWSSLLVYYYGLVQATHPAKQLATAENWLKTHSHDADLLLSLGRICTHNQLWGKAREYLETSINVESRVETYKELGKVLERLNDQHAAFNAYRNALDLI